MTRLLVAIAIALACALPAAAACIPAAVFATDALARQAPMLEWRGEAAERAFKAMADAGFSFSGESLIAVGVPGGAMIGIVNADGEVCTAIIATWPAWQALRVLVEGAPL